MPKIRLTPEALQQKATQVNQCMDTQKEVIADVAKLISDVVSDWEGEAQKGFINAFDNAKPTYEKFSVDLGNFANFLNNYSQTMTYLDVGGRDDITNRAAGINA